MPLALNLFIIAVLLVVCLVLPFIPLTALLTWFGCKVYDYIKEKAHA